MIEVLYELQHVTKSEVELIDTRTKTVGVLLDTRPFNIDDYPYLKVISRVGVGVDNIDLDLAKERKIKVFGTPCFELTQSVAEFTVCQILKFFRYHRRTLGGNNIGIIGYGRIGSRIEYLLSAYAKEFYVYDKALEDNEAMSTKEEVLINSSIIIIAVSGNDLIIGGNELSQMKDGTVLVNIAREECIDQVEVINALGQHRLLGFISDVNSSFGIIDTNILLTPHIASGTVESRKAMEIMAVENLRKGLGA